MNEKITEIKKNQEGLSKQIKTLQKKTKKKQLSGSNFRLKFLKLGRLHIQYILTS